MTRPQAFPVDATAAARRWADVWGLAWSSGDVETVAALYDPAARFLSHPFREPQSPRAYVEWAFGAQAGAECRFGQPIAAADRAAVDWWAVIEGRDGERETVAGTSLLRFGADGLVVEQRDVFGSVSGRVESPHWAR